MQREICVFIHHDHGNINRLSLETLSVAWNLSTRFKMRLSGLLIGKSIQTLAMQMGRYGLDRVYFSEQDEPHPLEMDQTVEVMIQILKEFKPSILLIGDIPYAREMGGRLAYRLKGSFIPDCIDLALDEELTLTGIRFLDGKKASMKSSGQATSYQIASVRGGIFSQQKDLFNKQCEMIKTQTPPLPKKRYEERIDYRKVDPLTLDISEAEVILAGGRGMKDVSHFRLLEELGKLLGGTVGCSRAVVDQGWLPKTKQIGQSGKTVAPKFYLASGISGASQHVLGMKDSQHIVAINKDEYAPIFKMADLGLVGDLFEILPLLIEALKKEK